LCLECVSETSLIRWIGTILPWLSEIVGLCPNPILLHAPLFNDIAVPIDWLVYAHPSSGKYVAIGGDKRKFSFKASKKLIQPFIIKQITVSEIQITMIFWVFLLFLLLK